MRAARAATARRGELDLTQEALAKSAGVDVKTIGNLETRGRWPIARNRARIEAALGWAPGTLDGIAEGVGDAEEDKIAALEAEAAELLAAARRMRDARRRRSRDDDEDVGGRRRAI